MVEAWHSHHDPAHVAVYALKWCDLDEATACVVASAPTAPTLQDGRTWEVSRLCVGPDAPPFAASRLLGAIGRVAFESGVDLLVSYTRVDERGTCYLASGWIPAGLTVGRAHDTGNRATGGRAQVALPGFEREPSTEIVDRVRWERGPREGLYSCVWTGSRWEALFS